MTDKMKNLAVRTLSGIVLAAVVLGAVVWSPWSFGALLLLLLVGGMHEFYALAEARGDRPQRLIGMVTGAVLFAVNFAFLGQFAETGRDTIFTTEYSMRTGMEAVYTLLNVDRGVPEVWGSVYDVRELLDSSVKLMDGKSPLQMNLGPLNVIKKPLLGKIKGTVIEKLLRDHDVLRDGML